MSGVITFANTDTLTIHANFFNIQVERASVAENQTSEFEVMDRITFENRQLPFETDENIFLQKIINFNGEFTTPIIVEPGGFHYVDIYLKNLFTGETVVNKTGRLLGPPENELYQSKSQVNKVKFTLEPNNKYELLVHYRNPVREKITIKLEVFDAETWKDLLLMKMSSQNLWLGAFFGTLILLSLINFIFYYLFRDRTYMVYVGYIVTILIYEATLYGIFESTGVIKHPVTNFVLSNSALTFIIIFYLLFIKAFLGLKRNYPKWNLILGYTILYLLALLVVSDALFFFEYPLTGFIFRNIGLIVIIPIAITFLSKVLLSKRLIDRVFFSGSIILVLSGLLRIIAFFLSDIETSDLYLQVGILVELVIFNIGLGLRSKVIQNEKDEELHTLIGKLQESEERQKVLNASLEDKVSERTEQINEINRELMTQRDQLFIQNETIEQNLMELNDVRKNLVQTVHQKTKELRQANKELVSQNAQLEQYAFITAHNLKAPVARLRGLVNIFELTNQTENPNNEIIYRIKEASLDMDDVISDINKILKIKNFNQQDRQIVEVDALINKIEARLKDKIEQNQVELKKEINFSKIKSIDTYLESILYNLIYNGIKYYRNDVDSFIKIQTFNKGSKFHIEVSDNGVGIDLDKYGDKIFGLYQRFHDHVNGKGIGLYLVKTQVEALNGNISIDSKINKGTTFRISFPTL